MFESIRIWERACSGAFYVSGLIALVMIVLSVNECEAKRLAFVFGISNYQQTAYKLSSPSRDANSFGAQLRSFGFATTSLTDERLTRSGIIDEWYSFLDSITDRDEVVVYYSGHGVEIDGANYIVPSDVPNVRSMKTPQAIKGNLLSLYEMMSELSLRNPGVIVWILDACRNNPFKAADGADTKALESLSDTGMAVLPGPGGALIFYAAGVGQKALDRLNGEGDQVNSLYTRVLLEEIKKQPSAPIDKILKDVYRSVRDKAAQQGAKQEPGYYSQIGVDWCFAPCARGAQAFTLATEDGAFTVAAVDNFSEKEITAGMVVKSLDTNNLASATEEARANAVFIGRRSLGTCKDSDISDGYPFGCPTLRRLVSGDASGVAKDGIVASTAVNVRAGISRITKGGETALSCVVDTRPAGTAIKLSAITELQSDSDVFYWGLLAESPKDCAGNSAPPETDGKIVNALKKAGIIDAELLDIIADLDSSDTVLRRGARERLTNYLSVGKASKQTIAILTDGLSKRSYRYQLGLGVALSNSGHFLSPTVDAINAVKAAKAGSHDATLTEVYSRALSAF